jgi:hypothetical protein
MSGTTTSPAAAFSSAALSDAEKADVRRFCGYPPYGGLGAAGFQGWRFFQAYGLLEFRMNNLAPAEFQNVRYRLSVLYGMEQELDATSHNLDTDVAAVWTHNKNETRDRVAHFNNRRRALCQTVGVPPGPDLAPQGTVGLVV